MILLRAFHDMMADADLDALALDATPSVTAADRRGGKVLTYGGYRYTRSNSSKTRLYWRCARRNCGETIITNRFDVKHENPEIQIERKPIGEHTHAPDEDQILRRQFLDEATALVKDDPSHTIRRAYNIVLDRGHHHRPGVPTFPEIRSQLQRIRLACVKRTVQLQ
eukprot:XP_001175490.2 PREDICTED: uncharacterized protein LOC752174 [Strongylocentrotus purpuratus]